MSAELPPVTLDIIVDTSRFQENMARVSAAWAALTPSLRQAIIAAARARAMTPLLRTGTLYPVTPAPYAHRTRWAGRRPRR